MKERNLYIDFLRGIAALAIIGIHTAFWLGESYTPTLFRSLTLLIDVPIFFFISGWAGSYGNGSMKKVLKGLGTIWLKWIYFVLILALICYVLSLSSLPIISLKNIRELVQNFVFNVSFQSFPVIAGSIWFIEPYFLVVLINSAMLCLMRKFPDYEGNKKLYLIILVGLYVGVIFGHNMLGLNQTILFYCIFYMLGMKRNDFHVDSFIKFFCGLGLLCICCIMASYVMGAPITEIQVSKFPPNLVYFFFSLIFIWIALYLQKYIKKPSGWLVHIGRNAIFYYFAQGIGSSLIYYLVNSLNVQFWFGKWIIIYICNVIVTSMIAELLALSYRLIDRILHKVLLKIQDKINVKICG